MSGTGNNIDFENRIAIGDRNAVIEYIDSVAATSKGGTEIQEIGRAFCALVLNLNLKDLGMEGFRYLPDPSGRGNIVIPATGYAIFDSDGLVANALMTGVDMVSESTKMPLLLGRELEDILDEVEETGLLTDQQKSRITEILPEYEEGITE